MKKIANNTDLHTGLHQKQGQELPRKLYRTITEQAKKLDDARSCARTVGDLFTPNTLIQRRKLCEYCERLIFSDPVLYGKKGEELLWRKGFYDAVSTAKKLKKNDDVSLVQTHINAGIGFYHHFISRIQVEFGVGLKNDADFPLDVAGRAQEEEWARNAIYQSLVYLGDLNRYKLEIGPDSGSAMAFRYYFQAVAYKPDHGMPHNQMGTLAMNQDNFLDAVYYYMRCLACTFSFEGTINNLHSLFEKNSKFLEQLPQQQTDTDLMKLPQTDQIKRFIARFLLLIDIWYFNKKIPKVYSLCHQTYKDLEDCLVLNTKSNSNCESPTNDSETDTNCLTNDMLFKITAICLLCISKLQKANSHQVSTVIAFTLAIYSQLIQNVTSHIQDSVLNYPISEIQVKTNGILKNFITNRKSRTKLRRRKALKIDDSDSDEEEEDVEDSSDDSFEGDVLVESSEDEAEEEKRPKIEGNDGKIDILAKVQRMDGNDMLEIITEESSLQSIKILNDFLMNDVEILKSCGNNTRSLLRQIVNLLNLININVNNHKLNGVNLEISNVISNEKKMPLSEDVVLKGIDLFVKNHEKLDWNYLRKKSMNMKEETVVRIIKMMAFGKFLTGIEETGVSFDENGNCFACKCDNEKEAVEEMVGNKVPNGLVDEYQEQDTDNTSIISKLDDKDGDSKGQLMKMKHMGQLWLASEVKALESRVKGKASLSPYLVLDSDALIKYTFMVKHLVHSRKFIVLIPSAVVSALDDLKREQCEARDAIRWLEMQFHRGNRFFRAQRPQECAPIPYIKYPKKKDKEMCLYIQIIECCHYLAEQQKGASNLVTLLIGNQNVLSNGENKEFSYVGLAESVGIEVESITQFYGKWKKSYKGKR